MDHHIEFLGKSYRLEDIVDGSEEDIRKQIYEQLLEKNIRQLRLIKKMLLDPRV